MKRFFELVMLVVMAGFLATVAVDAWQKQNIPPADDPTHPGQPKWCQNVDTESHVHNCSCQPTMDSDDCRDPNKRNSAGGESPKCKVYCRKDACRCKSMCGMTAHRKSTAGVVGE